VPEQKAETNNLDRSLDPSTLAYIFELKKFFEISDFIETLKKKRPDRYIQALYHIMEGDVLGEIYWHKIRLAKFFAKASKVAAEPEDYMRILFLLAKHADSSIGDTNAAFSKEFGPNFHVYESYKIDGGATKSWRDLAIRAREIKNGMLNHSYLIVKPLVEEIISTYKRNTDTDLEKIDKIYALANEIVGQTGVMIMDNPNAPENAEIKKKVIEFYKLTNRLNMDIERLDDEYNFDKITAYVNKMRSVYAIKLHMISKDMPFDNLEEAEKFLMKLLGQQEFAQYIDIEELQRAGVKLPQLKVTTSK
jgi:hypothetical protein